MKVLAAQTGQLMKAGKKEEAEIAKQRVAEIKEVNKAIQAEMDQAAEDMQNLLYTIPNVPYDEVPEGVGADDNKVEKMGGKIIYNAKVTKVECENQKIVSVSCENGEKYDGDYFISSMPLKDLVESMDNVPTEVLKVAEGLPYRDFVTVGILTEKLNLKNLTKIKTMNDLVPDCWIYVQDAGVKLGRIQIFNNWSPYMVAEPDKKVWIGLEYFCKENDEFWNMSEEACRKFAVDELIRMGILNSEKQVLDSHREKVKKAYPAYFDTYDQIDDVIAFTNEIDNLFCVGRNGQHRYNNMDHSMATSFEAVQNILQGVTDKTNIWSVNTEQEYHEEKQD